jgi:hypothetical protein
MKVGKVQADSQTWTGGIGEGGTNLILKKKIKIEI